MSDRKYSDNEVNILLDMAPVLDPHFKLITLGIGTWQLYLCIKQ